MKYRIVEHPEGTFKPQESDDGGVSYRNIAGDQKKDGYGYEYPTFPTLEKAVQFVEKRRVVVSKSSVNRVVFQYE